MLRLKKYNKTDDKSEKERMCIKKIHIYGEFIKWKKEQEKSL